ncbi:hypothetical protein ACLB2K_031680 [Fragaria x ananassa]
MATYFGRNSDSDVLIWPTLSSGLYSVKSGYKFLVNKAAPSIIAHPHHSTTVTQDTWDWIWKLRVAPKIKHFVWSAITTNPPSLLLMVTGFTSLQDWVISVIRDGPALQTNTESFFSYVAYLMWEIWKQRCDVIFKFSKPDPMATSSKAVAANEYLGIPPNLRTHVHVVITSNSLSNLKWGRPSLGNIKINTDATWDSTALSSGLAAIARNSSGATVGGLASQTLATIAVAAEAQAVLLGLSLATSLSLSSFTVESDSRLANSTADHVENLAKCGVCIGDWYSNLPLSLFRCMMLKQILLRLVKALSVSSLVTISLLAFAMEVSITKKDQTIDHAN